MSAAPALTLIRAPSAPADAALRVVRLFVDRITIAKRLWRGVAEDGREFGFELGAPLTHGDAFFQSVDACYVIAQQPEAVLEVSLAIAPSAAAGIGWAVGNLHLELQAEATRLLAADEPAARQLFARLNVPFTPAQAIFRPGRFARGAQQATHELGASHKH